MRVSAIIMSYNSEKFIRESIQSVQTQSIKPYEIIVIDDGSTDNTLKIANEMGIKKVHSQKHTGSIGQVRQKGVDMATGDYVTFLAADDVWHKSFLKRITTDWLQGTIAYCNYFRCDENLNKLLEYVGPIPTVSNILDYAERPDMFINFSSILIPMEVFDEVKFDNRARVGEDLIFVLECLLHKWRFTNVKHSMTFYRVHPDQRTTDWTEDERKYLMNKVGVLTQQIKKEVIL